MGEKGKGGQSQTKVGNKRRKEGAKGKAHNKGVKEKGGSQERTGFKRWKSGVRITVVYG